MILLGQPLVVQQLPDAQRKLGIVPAAFLPPGGNDDDVLAKLSAADYDFGWVALGSLLTAGNGIAIVGNTIHFAQAAAYAAGAIPFATAGNTIGFDAVNFIWDNTNKYLGIGVTPTSRLHVYATYGDVLTHYAAHLQLRTTLNSPFFIRKTALVAECYSNGNDTFNSGLNSGGAISCVHDGSGNTTGIRRFTGLEVYAGKYTSGTGNMEGSTALYLRSINDNVTGAITDTYDLYIDTPLTTGVITNNYPITQVNPAGLNSYAGFSAFGSTAPVNTTFALFGASTASVSSQRIARGTAAYAGTVEGDYWNDYTQKCLIAYLNGLKQFDCRVLYVSTADATITNTNAETTMFGAGIGALAIPANTFVPGKSLKINLRGRHTMDATPPSITFRVKLGGVTFVSVAYTDLNDTDQYFELDFVLTCRTTGAGGSGIGQGKILMHESTGVVTADLRQLVMTATAAMDTTASLTLDVTAQPNVADAGSTLTITNAVLSLLA